MTMFIIICCLSFVLVWSVLLVIGLVWIPLLYVFWEWSAYAITNSSSYLHTGAVGYSGVLFLYAVVEAFHDVRGSRLLCGVEIPSYLYPFIMLFALQLLVPGVSFVGHMSGVLVGLVIARGFCVCFFPSQATMISHFETPDSFCYELTHRLPGYIPVNTSQPEGFMSVSSGIDSSLMRSSESVWSGSCSVCSRSCGRCQEVVSQYYHQIRVWVASFSSQPSQEYTQVSRMEPSATIHDHAGVGSSTRDAPYPCAHTGGVGSVHKNQGPRPCQGQGEGQRGVEVGVRMVDSAEESSLTEMVRRGEQQDVRAIRLAKFANIAS